MEKEIKEDFTIIWSLWRLLIGFGVFIFLLTGVLMFFPDHDWRALVEMVAIAIAFALFARFGMRRDSKRAAANPNKWLLTNDGLIRLYQSGVRELIRWEQIRVMKWGKHVGLRIVCEEAGHDHRSPEFRDEIKSQAGRGGGWIRVDEAQAREIFQRAKRDWADMKL